MKTITRKQAKEAISSKGLEQAMRVPKGTLTPKMRKFAEQVALGNTGADAYRIAYNAQGKPATVGNHASQLKSQDRIKNEIERIERANELAALHSAQGLQSIVISTLAEIATNPESKDAVRVQAVRSIGQLVGVDAFRETKRVEVVKDSSEIREQIMQQLKTMMLSSDDVQDIDADSLLNELSTAEPHPTPTTPNSNWDSDSHEHTIPHEQSPDNSDSPIPLLNTPLSSGNGDGGGDIFLENSDGCQNATGRVSTVKVVS